MFVSVIIVLCVCLLAIKNNVLRKEEYVIYRHPRALIHARAGGVLEGMLKPSREART